MIKLYTVRDAASGTTNQPMSFTTERDAIDGLKGIVQDPTTTMHKHAKDFELYYLGEYCQRDINFNLLDQPKLVLTADTLLE